MFNFFKRASKKDAVGDKSAATSQKRQNSANENSLDKNKLVSAFESTHTNLAVPGNVTIEKAEEFSDEEIPPIMAPMAAFRNKGKNKKRNVNGQKNKNPGNKSNSGVEICENDSGGVAKVEATCSRSNQENLSEKESVNDTVHGSMKLKIDLPAVIKSSKNIASRSGDLIPNDKSVDCVSVKNETTCASGVDNKANTQKVSDVKKDSKPLPTNRTQVLREQQNRAKNAVKEIPNKTGNVPTQPQKLQAPSVVKSAPKPHAQSTMGNITEKTDENKRNANKNDLTNPIVEPIKTVEGLDVKEDKTKNISVEKQLMTKPNIAEKPANLPTSKIQPKSEDKMPNLSRNVASNKIQTNISQAPNTQQISGEKNGEKESKILKQGQVVVLATKKEIKPVDPKTELVHTSGGGAKKQETEIEKLQINAVIDEKVIKNNPEAEPVKNEAKMKLPTQAINEVPIKTEAKAVKTMEHEPQPTDNKTQTQPLPPSREPKSPTPPEAQPQSENPKDSKPDAKTVNTQQQNTVIQNVSAANESKADPHPQKTAPNTKTPTLAPTAPETGPTTTPNLEKNVAAVPKLDKEVKNTPSSHVNPFNILTNQNIYQDENSNDCKEINKTTQYLKEDTVRASQEVVTPKQTSSAAPEATTIDNKQSELNKEVDKKSIQTEAINISASEIKDQFVVPESEVQSDCKELNKVMGADKEKSKTVNGAVNKENTNKNVKKEENIETIEQINEMRNLVNQEASFQNQLTELNQQLSAREDETNKLRYQMEDLHRDLYIKSSGMDRLQAELLAAHKDSESVRQKLRHLQEDVALFKQKNTELGEELAKKSEEYKALEESKKEEVQKLQTTIKELTDNMKGLQAQLDNIKQEKDKVEQQRRSLEEEREEEKKIVQEALDAAIEEKQNIQKRWENDFEKLRNVNTDREQQMFNDFEWKLREVEQTCKRRLEEKDKKTEEKLREKQKEMDAKIKKAEEQITQVEHLKSFEAEVVQLRGLTNDQQRSLKIMARHTEELEQKESQLREEVNRLQTTIERGKTDLIMAKHRHEKELTDKERQLQIRLEQQRGEVAVQWEQKLRQECARLKSELEQMHEEEKHLAIELVKVQKDQEYLAVKKEWEQKIMECVNEMEVLKNKMETKDEKHRTEIERLRTNTDHEVVQMRRELDKSDMAYHEQIEKLSEDHEHEIERLNEEAEKRLRELETNCQMQVSSMRATLELVKEQMERESENKIQLLREEHRTELDKQWEKLMEEKDNAINNLEQEYRAKYEKLKDQFTNIQKNYGNKEKDLSKTIDVLKNEVNEKESTIGSLKNNVDTLNGGIQVLNTEIASQDHKYNKMKTEADQKISELQHMLKTERDHMQMEREEHMEEIAHLQKQSQNMIEQLQRKCQCLTKLFEEIRSRYDQRESRSEDLNLISDLRNVIAEQERDLAILNEEKRYYQMELMRLQAVNNDLGNSTEDFLSVGGSNQSLPEASSGERDTFGKNELVSSIRSKSAGYKPVKKVDHTLPSSLPG